MALSFKPGVMISITVQPEILRAIDVVSKVYASFATPCVVTSLCEGKHSSGSKHYQGLAADFRTRNVKPDRLDELVKTVRYLLGKDYDVVLESTHLHVEFDPPK